MVSATATLFASTLSLVVLLASVPLQAQEEGPAALVERVTTEVLAILRENEGKDDAAERRQAVELIETRIAPHFDFPRMTALAVGRGWRDADAAQRTALTDAFRTLLVRTYANALASYENETVQFRPAQKASGADQAIVRSQIVRPGATPISLDYRLIHSDQGWKVFDVAVDNVSLVTNYRSSFASELSKGGVDGLLKALQTKTRSLEAQPPEPPGSTGGAARGQTGVR